MSSDHPMSLQFTIALVLSIGCLTAPAWADIKAGETAYHRGDYATALREWQPLAEQGDPSAQYRLGVLYAAGWGVPQDYATAKEWYEKAAAQGNAQAQVNLGVLYLHGRGVPQDIASARQWFEKAAVQGNFEAKGTLMMLTDLQTLPTQAAQGDAEAQLKLGNRYNKGEGGVPQDYVRAYMWLNFAAAYTTGYEQEHAVDERDKAARRMTPAQIAEAQRLAQQCQTQHFKGC